MPNPPMDARKRKMDIITAKLAWLIVQKCVYVF